jgi:predicted rRNA methylase YqxC with S4 and FtsJ domains
MKKEIQKHLLPVAVLDVGEKLLSQKLSMNERMVLEQRIEAIYLYTQEILVELTNRKRGK